MNRLTYLYQNGYYWLMSPDYFNAGTTAANGFHQSTVGDANGTWVTDGYGLRPVIN